MTDILSPPSAKLDPVLYSLSSLERWAAGVFLGCGLPPASAAVAGRQLLLADAQGVATHGIARLPVYAGQLQQGTLKPRARLRLSWQSSGILRVQAGRMLGQLAAPRVLAGACERLKAGQGFVCFTLSNSGHLGALRTHLRDAVQQGYVAFLCQATKAVMAPAGAIGAAIGNNPFAFAAPRGDGPPLLIDLSASVVARGNLLAAQRDGVPLPPGWAIDGNGLPTTDAAAGLAGAVLPAAGHKGLALAMMVQVLAGALSGSQADAEAASAGAGVGAFGFVLDPAGFAGRAAYRRGMAEWIRQYKRSLGPSARIPGEQAHAHEHQVRARGLPLPAELRRALAALGDTFNLPFPLPIREHHA